MNRRRFLKQGTAAGAAIGFPTIVPSSVFGRNAPSNRVNLGLIGYGGRGSLLAAQYVNKDLAALVALSDCFENRCMAGKARINEKFGKDVCRIHRDYREILGRDDIDGVIVATHDHWHVPIAIAAARADKHMYVEKPLSPSVRWSQRLRKELAGRNLVFQYGANQRGADRKSFHTACDLVVNGYIGKLREIHVWCPDMRQDVDVVSHPPFGKLVEQPVPGGFDYDVWIGPAEMNPYGEDRVDRYGGWHRHETSLGYVAGWGAHPLDIALWGSGRQNEAPVRYEAKGRMPSDFKAEELLPLMKNAAGKFDPANTFYNTLCDWDCAAEFADGLKLRFMAAEVAKPELEKYHVVRRDHGTTFFGEDGWVGVDRMSYYSHDNNALRKVKPKPGDKTLNIHGGRSHMDHFIHAIKTGAESGCGFEAAFSSDLVSHMTDISARLRRKVEWDPKTGNIIGDDEANALLDRKPRAGYDFFIG
jgi:predicted dehydrogenase